MERMAQVSSWIYGWLVILYPSELRRRFGADMVEVFEDQLSEALAHGGGTRVFSLWCTALWELVSVGLPSRFGSTAVIAAVLSFMVSSTIALIFFHLVG